MKSARFDYRPQSSVDGLLDDLAAYGSDAAILAGGQSLIGQMNARLARPKVLLDISRLAALSGISLDDGRLIVGAATRQRDLEMSALVARHAPLIAAAMPLIGSPTVRNRGTIGGSLAFAFHTAELPACCVCLDARIHLQSRHGRRTVAAHDFFIGRRKTATSADEAIIAIEIPAARPDDRFAIREVSLRQTGMAIAGVAARGSSKDGMISNANVVFYGIADKPTAAPSVARLFGQSDRQPSKADLRGAIARDVEIFGDRDNPPEVRLHLAGVLAARIYSELRQ
jgi:carbon-monoxide dehydrogenase medium subunit